MKAHDITFKKDKRNLEKLIKDWKGCLNWIVFVLLILTTWLFLITLRLAGGI